MLQHGSFLGHIEINGNTERRMLHVFMPEECMTICDIEPPTLLKHHRELSFSPCTRGMFITHNADQLANGRYHELSGTRVGTFREGRSAPYGEGNFDVRLIQAIRLDLAYFLDGMAISISGTTLPGSKVILPGPSPTEILPPWHFKIQFDIPRANFKELFALNDLGSQTLNQVFDQYAKPRA